MVFKNLFKSKNKPNNVGKSGDFSGASAKFVNKSYLLFPDLDGEPTFELESALTVGSEVGQAIVEDDSVAPRHCTFTMAQDVISVMDHGSSAGTFINKKQIEPGRIFILQEKDKIKIGNLKAMIQIQQVEVIEENSHVATDDTTGDLPPLDESLDEQLDENEPPELMETDPAMEPPALDDLDDSPLEADLTVSDLDVSQMDEDQNEAPEQVNDAASADEDEGEIELDEDEIEEQQLEEKEQKDDPKVKKDSQDKVNKKIEKTLAGLTAIQKKQLLSNAPKDIKDREFDWSKELDDLSEDEIDKRARKVLKATGGKANLKAKKATVVDAANTVPRVLAILMEFVFTFYLLKFLYPMPEFKSALDKYPTSIWESVKSLSLEFIKPHYDLHAKVHIDKVLKEVPALELMFEDLISFLSSRPELVAGFYLFVLIRLITPILFGVSIGQALIGIKALGNVVIKRLLGPIRELFGLVLFPFIIFDLPAAFSNRTFKELVSFTHIEAASFKKTFALAGFWIFLFVSGHLFAPVIERGQIPATIAVSVFPVENTPQKIDGNLRSKDLKIAGKLPENTIAISKFIVTQKNKARKVLTEYDFIDTETSQSFSFSRLKEIKLINLLKQGISGNYLASIKYPEILKLTNDVASKNKNFVASKKIDIKKVLPELQLLLDGSFGMSLEKIQNHFIKHGPFLVGYLNFRDTLLGLIDEPIKKIEINQIGQTPFLILKNNTEKTIYLISLSQRNADLYKMRLVGKSDFYLSVLENIVFSHEPKDTESKKEQDYFLVTDMLTNFSTQDKESLQFLYETLFNQAKNAISSDDKFWIQKQIKSLQSIIQFIELMDNPDKDKVYQNLSDLLKAVQDRDKNFFGIKEVKSAKAY